MRRFFPVLVSLALLPTPAHAQEREWQLDATDQDAFLVFGVPQSDDVGVSFWCKLGSKKLKIMSPVPSGRVKAGKNTPMVMQIGGKDFALSGRPGIGAKGSEDSIEAETPASGPLIESLQSNDRFTIRVGGHDATYPLLDADLDGLLKLCLNFPTEAQQ
jgi:hypothetical protein